MTDKVDEVRRELRPVERARTWLDKHVAVEVGDDVAGWMARFAAEEVEAARAKGEPQEPTVGDAERLIRKMDQCTSIGTKVILLKNFFAKHAPSGSLGEPQEWVKFSDRYPPAGNRNPANTYPKKYFILHESGKVEWDVVWVNQNASEFGLLAWAEVYSTPAAPSSDTTTTLLGGGSEEGSETGRVKLSGVQDHSKQAQIVGGRDKGTRTAMNTDKRMPCPWCKSRDPNVRLMARCGKGYMTCKNDTFHGTGRAALQKARSGQ